MSAVMSFEQGSRTSAYGSTDFLPPMWEKVRNKAIPPRWIGKLDDTYELRREFLVGARMMGLELVDLDDPEAVAALAEMDPPRDPLQPQQLLIADAINAGNKRVVIEVPRRASKTTSVLCLLLGRCASRPRYKVTFSAQTGTAGTAALEEWVRDGLDRISPPEDSDLPPWLRGRPRRPPKPKAKPKAVQRQEALFGGPLIPDEPDEADDEFELVPASRGFRTRIGNARPGIFFDNGSSFIVLKPEHGAYRGKAADVSWLDEAQEIDVQDGDALLAGILPLQDTRPGSQIVISGTAGEIKAGPFWRFLDQLRNGVESMGGLDYAIDPHVPWELVDDEDAAMQLLSTVHPGVGTLTTEGSMRENYRDIPRPEWAREYLSLWPEIAGAVVIPLEHWLRGVASRRPPKPPRVAFGMAIKPGGGVAAIAAAWRNSKGQAYVEIIEHRPGTQWMPERLAELTTTYRGSTVAYDDIAESKATATEAQNLQKRPKLRVQTYRETAAGCVQFLRDLDRGTLKHFDDIGLNAAVSRAAKRETRNDSGVWLWTPSEQGADITCLDAATRALRNWDQHFARRTGGTTSIMAA